MKHNWVIAPGFKGTFARVAQGKYGRMFPDLPALEIDESLLLDLGRAGSRMDAATIVSSDSSGDNHGIPAGFTFLGQFIAHDITRDASLLHHARSGELRNYRTPRLDLEGIYGGGPLSNPDFFDKNDSDRFLLGVNESGRIEDLPRNPQGLALIADSRNDVHTVISQLHLQFLRVHNAVVDRLRVRGASRERTFEEARQICAWHYQWIVLHEFLPLTVGQELVDRIQQEGRLVYAFEDQPFKETLFVSSI
jgi:heme peroxidase